MMKSLGRVLSLLALVGILGACEAGEFTSDQKDTAVNGDEELQADPADDPQDDDPGQTDLPAETVEDPVMDLPPELPEDPVVEETPLPRTYPAGPYGTGVGSTMANLTFTNSYNEPLALNDFFMDDSVKLLFIFSTAGWCPTCATESQSLPGYYTSYHGRGLEIMAAVYQDDYQNPADYRDAKNYADYYGFIFPTVADTQEKIMNYFTTNTIPFNMLVDLTTMKILYKVHNFDYWADRTLKTKIDQYLNSITR